VRTELLYRVYPKQYIEAGTQSAGEVLTLDSLLAAKKLVNKLGSVEAVKAAWYALEEFG
jgi:hypothetical protein